MSERQKQVNSVGQEGHVFGVIQRVFLLCLLVFIGLLRRQGVFLVSCSNIKAHFEIRGPIANCRNIHDNYYYKRAGLEQLSEDQLYSSHQIFKGDEKIFPELINELVELPEVTKSLLLTGKIDNAEDFYEGLVYFDDNLEEGSDGALHSAINHDGSMLFSFNARLQRNAIVPIYYKRPVERVPLEERLTYYIHPLYLIADFLETDMSSKSILDIIEPLMLNDTCIDDKKKRKRNVVYCKKLKSIKKRVLGTEGGYHILRNLIKRKRSGALHILRKLIQYGLDIHIFEMFPQLFTLAVRSSNHSLVRFILSEISEARGTCSVQLGLPEALEAQSGQCSGSKPSGGDDSGVPPETVAPLSSSVSDKSEVLDLGFLSKLHGDDYTSHFHEIPDSSHGCHFRDQRRQQCSHPPRGPESRSIGCHQRSLVNMVDNYNHTSLFYAVENNDLEMAEILILNGACVNMWDPRTGQSPLMVALENHNGAMLSLIMDNGGDPLRISPISGQDVMDLAIQKNDGKMIERIVNHVNYDINTSYNDIGSIILEYATFQDKSDLKLIGKAFKKQLNREYFFKQLKDYEKEARHVLDIVKIRISDALLSRLLKMESKKKVAMICQVTDEDGRGTLWWSAYYGNIKQIQHLLYFYSKAIRNRWVGYQNCNPHKDDRYGIYPLNLIIRKAMRIPKKLIIDMLQFRDPQTSAPLILQILTKSKQPLRALKSIIHTLKESFNISYSFINIWSNGPNVIDPIYYALRKKLSTNVIYYLLELAVKYSEESIGSTSLWRRRVSNSVQILKNVKSVDILSMLLLHENHFSHFDHEDGHRYGSSLNDNLAIPVKKRSFIRNESDQIERSLLREPREFFTNSFADMSSMLDSKWRTNINLLLQSEESQLRTPSNTIPPEDFPLVITPPRLKSFFSVTYVRVDKSPESIAKIILGRGPSHSSVDNIRKLIEHAVGLDSENFQSSGQQYTKSSIQTGTESLSRAGRTQRGHTTGRTTSLGPSPCGEDVCLQKLSREGSKSCRISGKRSSGCPRDQRPHCRARQTGWGCCDSHHAKGSRPTRSGASGTHSRLAYSDRSESRPHLQGPLGRRPCFHPGPRDPRQFTYLNPLLSSSQAYGARFKPSSPKPSAHSHSSYGHPSIIPSHFLYPFGEASTDAIYSIVKLRPETIGEILTRVSYKSPSDAIRVLALLDALPSDFPPFHAHAYSPLQRAASILYQYRGQRDILPVIHALLSSRYVQLFSPEQLMESLNLLALMDYRPSNMMELFGGLPIYCQYYGTQSGNVRYHYSKSGYWEMNSSPSSREVPDESSLGSSVGIGDRKGTVGSEVPGLGHSERESGGHWSLSGSHYRGVGGGAEGDDPVHQDHGDGLGVESIRDGCPIKLSILERLRRIPALPWDKKLTESDIIFAILCFCTMMTLFSIYCNSNLSFYSICNSINKKLIKYSNKFNCEIPLSDAGCNFTMDFGLVFMLNIPAPSKDNLRAGLWNSVKACFLINKISDFPVKKYRNTQENLYESFQYSLISFIIKFSNVFNFIKLISILLLLVWIVAFQLYEEILCFVLLTSIAVVIYTLHGFRIDEGMYEQLSSCFKCNNSLLLPEIMILYEQTNTQVKRIARRAIYLHSHLKSASNTQSNDAKGAPSKQIQRLLVSRRSRNPESACTEISEVPEIGQLEISKLCYSAEKALKCYRLLFTIQLICLVLSFLITIKLPLNCYNSPESLIYKDWKHDYADLSSIMSNINSCRKLYQFQYPHLFHLTRFYPITVAVLHYIAFIYYWQLLSMISSPILSVILALYHFHSLSSIFNSALSAPISILLPNAKNSKLLISQSYSSKEVSRANSVGTPVFSGDKPVSKERQSNNNKSLINEDRNSIWSSNGHNSPNHANITKNSSSMSLKTPSNPNIRLQSVGEITSPGSLDISSHIRSQSPDGQLFSHPNTQSLLQPSNSVTPKNSVNNQSPEIRLSNFLKLNHYSTEIQFQDYEQFEINYSNVYLCNMDNSSEASYYQVLEAQIYPFFIWADSRRTSHRICKYFWKPIDLFRDVLAIITVSLAFFYYYVEFKSLPIKTIRLWNIIPISTLLLGAALMYIMHIMVEIHHLTVEFWQWVPDVYDILPICSNLLDSVETTMRLLPFLTSPFYILNTPVKLPLLYGSIFLFVMLINVNFN